MPSTRKPLRQQFRGYTLLAVFLDTETNGLDPFKHKILEIAFRIVDVQTGICVVQYETILCLSPSEWDLSDLESLKINGFSWDLVKNGKPIQQAIKEIKEIFISFHIVHKKAIFLCQNPSLDRAFFYQLFSTREQEELRFPYHWLDLASMFWAVSIRKGQEPWTLGYSKDKIAAAYHLPPETKPHRAMSGVDHLLICYEAVVGWNRPFA